MSSAREVKSAPSCTRTAQVVLPALFSSSGAKEGLKAATVRHGMMMSASGKVECFRSATTPLTTICSVSPTVIARPMTSSEPNSLRANDWLTTRLFWATNAFFELPCRRGNVKRSKKVESANIRLAFIIFPSDSTFVLLN